jgi:RsiW-degrading membrane proteinase PrsW (M82 family)
MDNKKTLKILKKSNYLILSKAFQSNGIFLTFLIFPANLHLGYNAPSNFAQLGCHFFFTVSYIRVYKGADQITYEAA